MRLETQASCPQLGNGRKRYANSPGARYGGPAIHTRIKFAGSPAGQLADVFSLFYFCSELLASQAS